MTSTIHGGEIKDVRIEVLPPAPCYLVFEYDGGAVVEHRFESREVLRALLIDAMARDDVVAERVAQMVGGQ